MCARVATTAFGPSVVPPGPPLETIKAALGGVLTAKQMADGFMMLANGDLPNGSVMRVTARARGTKVVHDLVVYGKEHGGDAVRLFGMALGGSPSLPPCPPHPLAPSLYPSSPFALFPSLPPPHSPPPSP